QPATNVGLSVTSGDPGEATVSPAVLTFTPANWNVPQTVTVTGVDDSDRDGDQVTSLTIAVDAAQSDDGFAAVAARTVLVTTSDDDLGWHNTHSPFDVDASGRVDAADVLTIINYINAHGSDPSLPPPPASPPPFYDVDDDGLCMPNDVLLVINYINNGGPAGSGEGVGASREGNAARVAFSMTRLCGLAPGPFAGRGDGPPVAGTRPPHTRSPNEKCTGEADLPASANRRRTTELPARWQERASDAVLETWDHGFEDELLSVLAGSA
nr:dockerin type I domain-containing protein [Pirellulaceae bacterium]